MPRLCEDLHLWANALPADYPIFRGKADIDSTAPLANPGTVPRIDRSYCGQNFLGSRLCLIEPIEPPSDTKELAEFCRSCSAS
jgi:hypothetical protein